MLGTGPVTLFLSYAPEDELFCQEFTKHLNLAQRQGLISTWYDRQISAGSNRAEEINQQLERAVIIILLISADFLASDYCYSHEMTRALQRHLAGEAQVVPILVRPCDWKIAPFAHLQILPRDAHPISTWTDKDEAWTNVVEEIRRVLLPQPEPLQIPSDESSTVNRNHNGLTDGSVNGGMLITGNQNVVQLGHYNLNIGQSKQKHMSRAIGILFLAASPKNTDPLKLDEEMRSIDLSLRQSEFRDVFDIKQHWALRVTDLQGYLLRHQPDIVHFSGHGSSSSELLLEDMSGNSHPVSPRALGQVFSVLKDNVRCVVLNACYSERQAQTIAQSIDCVVGMSRTIGDAAAISFATAFYQALGYGRSVKIAFDLGCAEIDLENLDEQDTPKLLAINCNPANITFVESHS